MPGQVPGRPKGGATTLLIACLLTLAPLLERLLGMSLSEFGCRTDNLSGRGKKQHLAHQAISEPVWQRCKQTSSAELDVRVLVELLLLGSD